MKNNSAAESSTMSQLKTVYVRYYALRASMTCSLDELLAASEECVKEKEDLCSELRTNFGWTEHKIDRFCSEAMEAAATR